jgi:hypothetical protein
MVKSSLLTNIIQYNNSKRMFAPLIMLTLLIIITMSIFNKRIIENLESSEKKKVELTLISDNSSQIEPSFMAEWEKIKAEFANDKRVIIDQYSCANVDDYFRSCKGGEFPYESVLKNKVATWQQACPWIGITIIDNTKGELNAVRSFVGIGGIAEDKSKVKATDIIKTVKEVIENNNIVASLPTPTPSPEPKDIVNITDTKDISNMTQELNTQMAPPSDTVTQYSNTMTPITTTITTTKMAKT